MFWIINFKKTKMQIIKIEHIDFKPIKPIIGFEKLLEAENFKFEFQIVSEEENILYLSNIQKLEKKLKKLKELILLAKENFQISDDLVFRGIFLLFNSEVDGKTNFYAHIQSIYGTIEPIGQFQLSDTNWESSNNEISNSFKIGFNYPYYILSENTLKIKIIPLLINYYDQNKDEYLKINKHPKDLLIDLRHICIS